MSVTLPPTEGSVLTEYLPSITLGQSIEAQDGVYSAKVAISINYSRTDYMVNAAGQRTGIIQSTPSPADTTRWGSLSLTPEQVSALGDAVAMLQAQADELVHADLVAKGVIHA